MAKFCISCGTALNDGARFCGSCGAPVPGTTEAGLVDAVAPVSAPPAPPPPPPVYVPAVESYEPVVDETVGSGPNWLLIGGGGLILALLLGYYLIFIRDDVSSAPVPSAPEKVAAKQVEQTEYFAVADANIRNKATTVGTSILGKLIRGTAAKGDVIVGEDGSTQWLELADGKGFIAMSNLSETEPPVISKPLGDRAWNADKAMDLYATADVGGTVLDRISAGTPLTLFGLTANGFIEVKLKKGGVGYIADGERIATVSGIKGKPVALAFNSRTCSYGPEIDAMFAALSAKAGAQYKAASNKDYASDEERDQVLGRLEQQSSYQKLQRSWEGLTITGIAGHYESQSLFFAEPAAQVISTLRGKGYKISGDGSFPMGDVVATVAATTAKDRTYGLSDLGCGV
jgi:zinc-ribbon domain